MKPRHDDAEQVARVRAVFDDWALRGRAESMADSHAPFVMQVLPELGVGSGTRFLDIGCGNGYTVRWAAARGASAWGLDVAPAMLDRARALSAGIANTHYVLAAFPPAPLPRESFDVIFSMEVFYYLGDLAGALAEATSLLVPGGRLAVMVDYYEENAGSHSWPDDLGVGMNRLSKGGWREALEQAGLVVTQGHVVVPDSPDEWKRTGGSLLTVGTRPA